MVLKEADDRTADLAELSALIDLPELTKRQRDKISEQIAAIRTGDRGERDVAYFLRHGLRDSPNTLVIHDLRLEFDGQTAQIDHLVISRYRLAYVLETKSLNANLECNEVGEWTAWYGAHKRGTPVPIASPIEQARRHVDVLRRWLTVRGWTTIKRIDPVVVVSPTTFVNKTRAKGDEAVAVVRSDLFARWWEHDRDIGHVLGTPWLMASRYSTAQLAELGARLVADHRPATRNWRARFGLPPASVNIPLDTVKVVEPSSLFERTGKTGRVGLDNGKARPGQPAANEVREILTPFGLVDLRRVGDGRYAIRHGQDQQLQEHVRRIGQAHESWQPRFKNWLVPATEVETVAAKLQRRV